VQDLHIATGKSRINESAGRSKPGGQPLRGIKTPRVSRLLDHPLNLADHFGQRHHPLALLRRNHGFFWQFSLLQTV
jgi:hypothetical protein